MDTPILQLHHPADPQVTLRFITDDKRKRLQKTTELSENPDIEIAMIEETLGEETIYLLYTRTLFEAAYPDFETDEEVIEWMNTEFSEDDLQVLIAVIEIFDGILTEKEDQNAEFSTYKRMDLEKLPGVLNRVQWRQSVPEVGAELLSYFILAHPMPNTNHRTGIGLLDRYLTPYDESFIMPDTGEEGQWYEWAREYIYDSKRILTLRTQLPLLRWGHRYGYEVAARKEGIEIDLGDVDLEREDYREYYTTRHLDRSRIFVETALDAADAIYLSGETDDGKRAFVDRLRGGE